MTHIEGRFEWDTAKAKTNFEKHGVSFDEARRILDGPVSVILPAKTSDTGEVRRMTLGPLHGVIIAAVVTADCEQRIRIISARVASEKERKAYHERIPP